MEAIIRLFRPIHGRLSWLDLETEGLQDWHQERLPQDVPVLSADLSGCVPVALAQAPVGGLGIFGPGRELWQSLLEIVIREQDTVRLPFPGIGYDGI